MQYAGKRVDFVATQDGVDWVYWHRLDSSRYEFIFVGDKSWSGAYDKTCPIDQRAWNGGRFRVRRVSACPQRRH